MVGMEMLLVESFFDAALCRCFVLRLGLGLGRRDGGGDMENPRGAGRARRPCSVLLGRTKGGRRDPARRAPRTMRLKSNDAVESLLQRRC